MIDPMGALIAELKAVPIASARVRGGQPAPGDARPKGSYRRFVVLVRLGVARFKGRAPIANVRMGYRAYGVTFQDAAALAGELSDAVHNRGPRIGATSVLVYRSYDDTGGAADTDPTTGQPLEEGVIELFSATTAVV